MSSNVRINSYAHVEDSILYEGVDVGRHCHIRRAIIDKGLHIPAGARIGVDTEEDLANGFTVSAGGVVVIAATDGVEHLKRSSQYV